MMFNIIPSKFILPSTISLVVPGIFVTIAFSSSNNAFNILLLPTFGLPTNATDIPSLIILPFLELDNNSFIFEYTLSINGFNDSFVYFSPSSYSG